MDGAPFNGGGWGGGDTVCVSVFNSQLPPLGSFSEHLDQLTPRGEGVESPDSSGPACGDPGVQSSSLRPESAGEKTRAVPKVPKSVSTGALSLMIPGGQTPDTLVVAEVGPSHVVSACLV